jgi:hypothetical protein
MIIPDLIFSIVVALIVSVVFARIIHRQGPRRGFFWFFLIIFLAVFAAGIWEKPNGEPFTDTNWLPFLLAGVLMALLLLILAPSHPNIDRESQLDRNETMEMLDEIGQEKKFEALTYVSLNLFLWMVIALLVAAIIARFII